MSNNDFFIREISIFLKETEEYIGSIYLRINEEEIKKFFKNNFDVVDNDTFFLNVYNLQDSQLQELKKIGNLHVNFNTNLFDYCIEVSDIKGLIRILCKQQDNSEN